MSPESAVLIVVVLSAWPASSLAIAGSLRMHMIPSSHASDEMNTTHVPVLSMKSNADMTAHNITDEERVHPLIDVTGNGPEEMMQSLQHRFRDEIFQRPYFSSWKQDTDGGYLKNLNPTAVNNAFRSIWTVFGDDLARILVAEAKTDGPIKYVAEALLDRIVAVWQNDDTFDPVKVFKILELDQAHGNLFEHPLFHTWVDFVRLKFPNGWKNANEARFETLKVFFPGSDLVTVLVAGMKIESHETLALRLLDMQFREWKEKPIPYNDMFRLLKLSEGNLLENILFFRLTNFIFRKKSREMASTILFNTMEEGLGDRLVSVLVAGTKIERTQRLCNELLGMQLEAWRKNLKTEDEVFELLGLKQTEGNLLASPTFSKWKQYVYETCSSSNEFIEKSYMGLKHGLGTRLDSVLFEGAKTESTRNFANELLSMDKVLKEAMTHFEQLKQTHGNVFVNRMVFKWFESVQSIFPNIDSLEQLFSHDELAGIILSGWKNSETKPIVVELMNSLSDKKAVFQCVMQRVGLVR